MHKKIPFRHIFLSNILSIKKTALYLHSHLRKPIRDNYRLSEEGPFVYRLGRKIFILERAVRFCYGLHEGCRNDRRIRIGGGRLRSRRAKEADPRTERDGRKGVRRVLFITGADPGSIRKQPRLSQGLKIEVKNKHTTNYGKP